MTRRDDMAPLAGLRCGDRLPRVCVLREVGEVVAFCVVAYAAVSLLMAVGGA